MTPQTQPLPDGQLAPGAPTVPLASDQQVTQKLPEQPTGAGAGGPVPPGSAPLPPQSAPPASVPPAPVPPASTHAPVPPAPAPPAGRPEPQPEPRLDPQPRAKRPPLRIAMTILHLAAVGVVGFTVIGLLFGALGTGLGLLLVLGIGAVVLVGLVYALFGIAWFETHRVSGLYLLDTPTLRLSPQEQPGFKGWLRSIGRQSIDGRMWRALANFGIASLMGIGVLGLAQGLVHSLIGMFRTFSVWWQPGLIGAVLCAAGIVALALLHRLISVAIVGADVKEEQLTEQVRTSTAQREGAVRAADVERTRIERDLHDGVQPRLVSVGMTLGLAQEKIDTDPEAAKALVAEAHTSTKAAITELRQLARGIYASVLDDRGLDAALSALAARSHVPVQLDVRLPERCSRDAEAAVYFAIAESLTNAAKHSRASECRVVVRVRDERTLWARVEDNGIGGATVLPGGGLDGVKNRVLAAGGTTRLDSPLGGPTTLEVSVPCAS
ncbi:sensor histidine kinase [Leucobacter tenebrionis]|uniref:sensor histidine kinase n=1 Tax=Leucobacter tenebrionis TaxID=2873270 RepID=UPI00210428AD|nr:histidine kinase [Leucobacter tenebrionis]